MMKRYKLALCIFCCLVISFCFTQDALTEEISTKISNTEVSSELTDFEREMIESYERENSPEYKAQQEAKRQVRIQRFKKEAKEKQEKELQQERAEKLKLIYYGTIIGIILCVICAITGCDVVHLVATWLFKEYKP